MKTKIRIGIVVCLISLMHQILTNTVRRLTESQVPELVIPKNPAKKNWIEEIKKEELENLSKSLKSFGTIKSNLVYKKIEMGEIMPTFPAKILLKLPTKERLTAGKLLFISVLSLNHKMSFLQTSSPHFKCEYNPKLNSQLSGLSVLDLESLMESYSDYIRIFSLWYNKVPALFKNRNKDFGILPSDILEIKNNAKKFSGEMIIFEEKFAVKYDNFLEKVDKLSCNIKDFVGFYGALYRFYSIYKKVPDSTTKDTRMNQLIVVWSEWREKVQSSIDGMAVLRFLTLQFREFLFYVENGVEESFLVGFQRVNIRSLGLLTAHFKFMTGQKIRYFEYFKKVRQVVSSLEYSMKLDLPPLLFPKTGYKIRVWGIIGIILFWVFCR